MPKETRSKHPDQKVGHEKLPAIKDIAPVVAQMAPQVVSMALSGMQPKAILGSLAMGMGTQLVNGLVTAALKGMPFCPECGGGGGGSAPA